MSKLYSVTQLAEIFSHARSSIVQAINEGRLDAQLVGGAAYAITGESAREMARDKLQKARAAVVQYERALAALSE